MSNPDLHALLVGINKYEFMSPLLWLQYCHSDVNLFKSYLDSDAVSTKFNKVNVRVMTEESDVKPTKAHVIQAFRDQLGKAKPGDTAVFFFSGHGAREDTDVKSFRREELDGQIGGLVMQDFGNRSLANPGQTMLADKEIRYLIKELEDKGTEEHPVNILVLFDCCHSGESTRAVLGDELPQRSRQIKRGPVGRRKLEEFFFCEHADIKARLEAGEKLDEVLPQGKHVMLAACREVELAWEGTTPDGKKNGRFTLGLVDVLNKHNGDISYHELHSRVMNRMRFVQLSVDSKDYRQTPQFYFNTGNLGDRYREFLTHNPMEQPSYGAVEKNGPEVRFTLGALHGVPIQADLPTQVKLYPANDSSKSTTVRIKSVFPTHSLLEVNPENLPDSVSWRGEVNALVLPKLRVALTGEQKGIDLCREVFAKRLEEADNPTLEILSEEEAEYRVHAFDGKLQIQETGGTNIPRVLEAAYVDFLGEPRKDQAEVQYEYLNQIARWSMLRDLEHNGVFKPKDSRSAHPQYPVELKVYEYDPETKKEAEVPTKDRKILIDCTPEKPIRYIRFELINRTPQELFVSLIYMPHTFGFLTKEDEVIMHKAQLGLGPMKEPSMGIGEGHIQSSVVGEMMNGEPDKTYIPFQTGAYIHSDNWPGIQEYLKLMVSEVPFDVEPLHMGMLPGPGEEDGSRFTVMKTKAKDPVPQWELTTWSMYISNPEYNPPSVPV